MAEKRLNLDQIPLIGGSGGSVGTSNLVTHEGISAGGGSHVEATTTFSPVPGTMVGFTLNLDSDVFFEGFGCSISQGATELHNCQIGVKIDGIDYEGTAFVRGQIAAPQGHKDLAGLKVSKGIALLAGAHTAELVIRKADPAGPPVSAELATSALYPAILTAVRMDPIAVVGSLTKQEAVAQGGGSFSTTSDTYVAVPGTSVTVILNTPQTVFASAYGSTTGGSQNGGQMGIRVTSPGPTVIDLPGQTIPDTVRPLGCWRAINLGVGSHTIEMIVKDKFSSPTINIATTADDPAVVSVIYTAPEEIVKLTSIPPEIVNAGDVSFEGVLGEAARADHEHGVATAAPVDIGTANAEGASTSLARADHVHNIGTHDLGGSAHTADTKANLDTKVSDGSLISTIGGEIDALTSKATPAAADQLMIEDSADSNNKKKITVGSIPTVETIKFNVSGALATGTKLGGTWVAGRPGTITRVTFHRETAGGTGGSTIVDVNIDGVTIFTTQGNRPTVTQASGNDQFDAVTNMDVTAFAQDAKVTFDIDQIETGTAPEDGTLTVEVTYP